MGQHGDWVRGDDGDYLILRMPIFPEMAIDASGNTLRYWVAYQRLFRIQVASWCAQLPIKHNEVYHRGSS